MGIDGVPDPLSVERVVNSEIGDSVNYIDPFWMTRTNCLWYYRHAWDSSDGFGNPTTGSGSATVVNNNLRVQTGATDGSTARHIPLHLPGASRGWRWENPTECRFLFDVEDAKVEGVYVVMGSIDKGSLTNNHIGFGVESNGDFVGTVADGTTRNTLTIVADAEWSVSQLFDVRFALDPTNDEVEFFHDGESQGTLSSNVPTGTTGAANLTLLAFNADTGGSDGKVDLHRVAQVQKKTTNTG